MRKPWLAVIDDDPLVGDALKLVLEDAGFRVVTAWDRASFQALLRARGFQIAVCDVQIPGAEDGGFIRELSATLPDLPIVGMSGLGAEHGRAIALAAGAHAFVAKPARATALYEAIAAARAFKAM